MRPPILFLLLACFCLKLNAQTQAPKSEPSPSGPSMEETAQWIVNKLPLTGEHTTTQQAGGHLVYEPIGRANVQSCILSYRFHWSNTVTSNSGRYGVSWDETDTFHLGAIVGVQVGQTKEGTFDVLVHLSSQADKKTYENSIEEGGWKASSYQQPTSADPFLPFGVGNGQDNDDLSKRMQKALTHGAELCAASYKERNGKEPF
jgi:hypothetical protein